MGHAVSGYLCDTNVWLSLILSGHPHHRACRQWWDTIEPFCAVSMPRSVHQSVLRLLTTRAMSARLGLATLSNDAAWDVLEAVLSDDRISIETDEPVGLDAAWRRYAARSTSAPKLWMDAYLAAFALCRERTLVTLDRACSKFDGVDLLVLGGRPD